VRWLAAEGLIAAGSTVLAPLLGALARHSNSIWLRLGSHHVLRDLGSASPTVRQLVAPVLEALEGPEPAVRAIRPAYTVLEQLAGSH
jgi:hypothetical protein